MGPKKNENESVKCPRLPYIRSDLKCLFQLFKEFIQFNPSAQLLSITLGGKFMVKVSSCMQCRSIIHTHTRPFISKPNMLRRGQKLEFGPPLYWIALKICMSSFVYTFINLFCLDIG